MWRALSIEEQQPYHQMAEEQALRRQQVDRQRQLRLRQWKQQMEAVDQQELIMIMEPVSDEDDAVPGR